MSIYPHDNGEILPSTITDKCIVLDIDSTLVSTQHGVDKLKEFGIMSNPELLPLRKRTYYFKIDDYDRPGSGTVHEMWGITRPHLQEFLIFCFSYFKIVAIWSAGTRPYVEAIVEYIFRDLPRPHIVFAREDTIIHEDGYTEKPLVKIINYDNKYRKYMSLENTLALDDNETTFARNPGNGILIPPYNPSSSISSFERDDPTLLQLMDWLLLPEVVYSPNVTQLDKTNIFINRKSNYAYQLS